MSIPSVLKHSLFRAFRSDDDGEEEQILTCARWKPRVFVTARFPLLTLLILILLILIPLTQNNLPPSIQHCTSLSQSSTRSTVSP